jgi:RsmE family RNA methyltransferase
MEAEFDNSFSDILLLVGPEGGFSKNEVDLFIRLGFLPVSLGSTRLRTETAVITGLSVINTYLHQQKEEKLDT